MKINDYVRTEDGRIGKIVIKGNMKSLTNKDIPYVILDIDENKKEDYVRTLEDEIVKCSPNIISLIEEGDFVNGEYVSKTKDGKPFFEDYNDPYYSYSLDKDEIYTIVTKQQFKAMEYKVNE